MKDKVAIKLLKGERVVDVCDRILADSMAAEYKRCGYETQIIPLTDIVSMEDDIETKAEKLITACKAGYEVYMQGGLLAINVESGDWKHDHIFIDNIMADALGVKKLSEKITEDTGDDVFSATHFYMI